MDEHDTNYQAIERKPNKEAATMKSIVFILTYMAIYWWIFAALAISSAIAAPYWPSWWVMMIPAVIAAAARLASRFFNPQ